MLDNFPQPSFDIFVLRHFPSLPNERDEIVSDPERGALAENALSERGLELLSERTPEHVERLSEYSLPRLVSSPFSRTLETAQGLAKALGCEVLQDFDLRERFFGELEGTTASLSYPEVWERDAESAQHKDFSVESVEEVAERIAAVIDRLELAHEKEEFDVAVLVAHGDIGQIALVASNKLDLRRHHDSVKLLEAGEMRQLYNGL